MHACLFTCNIRLKERHTHMGKAEVFQTDNMLGMPGSHADETCHMHATQVLSLSDAFLFACLIAG